MYRNRTNSSFLCATCGERHRSNFFQKNKTECAECIFKRQGHIKCYYCNRDLDLDNFLVNKTGQMSSGCSDCYEQRRDGKRMYRRNECAKCNKLLPISEFISGDDSCVDCRARSNGGKIKCKTCGDQFVASEYQPRKWTGQCTRFRSPNCIKCTAKSKRKLSRNTSGLLKSTGKMCQEQGCKNPADLEYRGKWICDDCVNRDDYISRSQRSMIGNAWSHTF